MKEYPNEYREDCLKESWKESMIKSREISLKQFRRSSPKKTLKESESPFNYLKGISEEISGELSSSNLQEPLKECREKSPKESLEEES